MKSFAVIFSLLVSTSAFAEMYANCTPVPNSGTRHYAGKLNFDEGSGWRLTDGNRRVRGELRGNPEGRGFVVLSENSHGTWVYKFFTGRCSAYSEGTATVKLNNVLLNTYKCECDVD